MDIYDVKIGTRFELELVNNLDENISRAYVCQLLDVLDNQNAVVSAPIHQSRVIFIPTGGKARITFIHEKFGLLSFYASIDKKGHAGNVPALFLKIESSFEKVQRRRYYRQECNLNVQYCVCNEHKSDNNNEAPEYFEALTKNISGNGACIATEKNVPKDTVIELTVNLNSHRSLKLKSKVVRSTKIENTKADLHELGLHFQHISERDQDAIVKFIFEEQKRIARNNRA